MDNENPIHQSVHVLGYESNEKGEIEEKPLPKCFKCGEEMGSEELQMFNNYDGPLIINVCENKKCPNYSLLQVDLSNEN